MRYEAAKMAAIFILVEWLFGWLFDLWLPQNIFLHRRQQERSEDKSGKNQEHVWVSCGPLCEEFERVHTG
jgi:hypothetical protein